MTAAGTPGGLAPVLKALGLSGMLGTLDTRLAEARQAPSGTPSCSRCCARTSWPAATPPRSPGGSGPPASPPPTPPFGELDWGYNPKLPAAAIRDLARLEFITAGEGILAYGPVGMGKSHLAAALGHQACRRGHDVAFTTCPSCWPTWPAGTPTAASRPASASSPRLPS